MVSKGFEFRQIKWNSIPIPVSMMHVSWLQIVSFPRSLYASHHCDPQDSVLSITLSEHNVGRLLLPLLYWTHWKVWT